MMTPERLKEIERKNLENFKRKREEEKQRERDKMLKLIEERVNQTKDYYRKLF